MLFARKPSSSELAVGHRSGGGRRAWKSPVIAGAIVLVAVGCSDDDAFPEAATETTAAPTTTTAAPATTTTTAAPATTSTAPIQVPLPAEVTETYSIPGFGYSIDYPSGWFAETREPNTQLGQIDDDLFSDSIEGLRVSLDHRTVVFLQGIGLASDDPTAQDLVEFNTTNFDWMDVRDLTEVEVFGGLAIRVRFTEPDGGESVEYQGIRSDTGEAFLFGFRAPNDEVFDEFLPTWDVMFESITTTG